MPSQITAYICEQSQWGGVLVFESPFELVSIMCCGLHVTTTLLNTIEYNLCDAAARLLVLHGEMCIDISSIQIVFLSHGQLL